MKITEFEGLWRAVQQIKRSADVIGKIEIERQKFEHEGLDTDLTEVYSAAGGELFTVLSDGTIRKSIVYICDISHWYRVYLDLPENLPKFHTFECKTLEDMRNNNRGYRYRKASRTDGQFWIITAYDKEYKTLMFCKNCLKLYNETYNDHARADNFDIEHYMQQPIKHQQPYVEAEDDMTTIPKSYARNWPKIAKQMKDNYNWTCQACFRDLSQPHLRQYLHTHHIDADPDNNKHENLKVVCVACHAQEFLHGRMKATLEYKAFLRLMKIMRINQEWISIADMMAGLMMVFLFIAVLFMNEIQKEQVIIKEVVKSYQTIQQQLNADLNAEFKDDLSKWNAEILRDNTVRFKSPDVLFDSNSSDIKPIFKDILNDFFPRYLRILTNSAYRNNIQEVRIEGHTSSIWQSTTKKEEAYLHNMLLSQNRARKVLSYTYQKTASKHDRRWLEKHLRANGMSFAKLIKNEGKEDVLASQRVEFRVVTKAEEKIYEIIEKLQAIE